MKLITINSTKLSATYKDPNRMIVNPTEEVTVAIKSWYDKPSVWIAIITGLMGIAGIISQIYPTISFFVLAVSILQTILTTVETVIPSSAIVDTNL